MYHQNEGPNFCAGLPVNNCRVQTDAFGDSYQACEYRHSDSWGGANYVSPITDQCSANHIIFVSDGRPFNTGNASGFEQITGMSYDDWADQIPLVGSRQGYKGNCGPELLEYINNNDLIPSIADSKVTTHTVAFGVTDWGRPYLSSLADAGGGVFYNTQSQEDLLRAFDELFSELVSPVDNISQFSIGVDRVNASHDDRMYILSLIHI